MLCMEHVNIISDSQVDFCVEVQMFENKVARIEQRLKGEHEAVHRLEKCCSDYLGYASDEDQRKNISQT